LYSKEVGKGKTGIVNLFESESGKKIAVKTFKPGHGIKVV
jgi:hypothetical protein